MLRVMPDQNPEMPIGSARLLPRKPTRQERVRHLRRLAVTWTVVAFAAAWGLIAVQLRSGDDPALSSAAATTTVTTPAATTADTADTVTADSTDTTTSGTADYDTTTTPANDEPAAATTAQS